MRQFVIGIDDGDLLIINNMNMPFLKAVIENNMQVDLKEDLLSRGWAEFYTGLHAKDSKAFYDWPMLDDSYRTSQKFNLNVLGQENIKPLWDLLSERNVRVGIMNVPTTTPVASVDGFMVSGGGGGQNRLKQAQTGLCFPEAIIDTLNDNEYIVDIRLTTSGISQIQTFFDAFKKMTRNRTRTFIDLCKSYLPDFGFLAFRSIAIIQYLGMAEIEYLRNSRHRPKGDPEHHNSVYFRSQLQKFYRFFDDMLERLFEELNPEHFIIFSDHGKAPYLHNANYNQFLVRAHMQTPNKVSQNTTIANIKKLVPQGLKRILTQSKSKTLETMNLPFRPQHTTAFSLGLINGIYINDNIRFGGPVRGEDEIENWVEKICIEFNRCDEAIKYKMHAAPYRIRHKRSRYHDYLPDIWIDKPDTIRPVGIGQFIFPNDHYEHITDLHKVHDDNWTGIKSRTPIFILDHKSADLIDKRDQENLTIGFKITERLFGN
jgi:predicted AlkP superfamily phosphohydrolase/phosphomutase